ncbi:diguanylate cyclase [Thiohalocapsa marina]|uniref:diguanylate cyclase n=1 Tax=Thiohalocapsa marina TaxID=424902 RepID=A0A5M8FQW3_9GAMM|nr:sensor domain-containing diguanylate cyclase [Thiohalocapsa marina]KAA6185671.1 diguanylate cyclase [Thiohalocapsa marina]
MSLRTQRLVLLLLVATVVVAAIGSFAYRVLRDDIREETQRTLAVIAEQKRQRIESWVAAARTDAASFYSAHAPHAQAFARWLDGGRQPDALIDGIRARMAELVRMRQWGGMALFDRDNQVVLAVGDADAEGDPWKLQGVLQHPAVIDSALYRDRHGAVQFGVLAPFGLSGEPPRGVLSLTWPAASTLDPLVASWPMPTRTAETYLVRRERDRVRFLTPLRHQAGAALRLTQPLDAPDLPAARAARGELGILAQGVDYRGLLVLAYATAIRGTPWLMIAEIDESEAYAGLHATAWSTALVAGLTLLLLYAVGYGLWHRDRQRQQLAALQARQAVEARFRTLFEASSEAVMLLDRERFLDCNAAALRIFGIPDKAVFKRLHPGDLSPPNQPDGTPSAELARTHIDRALETGSRTFRWAHRRADTGLDFPCEVVLSTIELDGARVLLATVRDFTEHQRLQDQLRDSEARIRRMLEHLPIPIVIGRGGDADEILFLNRAFVRTFGYTLEDIPCGDDWFRRAYPDATYRAEVMQVWADAIADVLANPGEIEQGEYRVTCKNGRVLDVVIGTIALDDLLLISLMDISERKAYEQELEGAYEAAATANRKLKELNQQLEQLATTDALTGTWNRRHFERVAATEIARAHRYCEPLSLLLFDLDHFKAINDSLGHQVGDQVLIELSDRVKSRLREVDVLARWGGEEFVVLLPGTREAEARSLAEQLRERVAGRAFALAGQVTVSFGVAELGSREAMDAWLKRVDDALYAAKAAGRNRVCLAAPEEAPATSAAVGRS